MGGLGGKESKNKGGIKKKSKKYRGKNFFFIIKH